MSRISNAEIFKKNQLVSFDLITQIVAMIYIASKSPV